MDCNSMMTAIPGQKAGHSKKYQWKNFETTGKRFNLESKESKVGK